MPNLVNLVNFRVKPGHLDKIKPAMIENARNSVKEPDCYQFDVIESADDDHSFVFYEVYKDEAALAEHRTTAHFQAYWALLEELGDNVERAAQLYWVVD